MKKFYGLRYMVDYCESDLVAFWKTFPTKKSFEEVKNHSFSDSEIKDMLAGKTIGDGNTSYEIEELEFLD